MKWEVVKEGGWNKNPKEISESLRLLDREIRVYIAGALDTGHFFHTSLARCLVCLGIL